MTTLLLRLAGPMQSWGTQSRFTVRDTGREPSKSGVVGLLCAALGRPRHAAIDDLAALRMGIRVNHEGSVRVDYQTAGGGHLQGEPYGVAQVGGGTRAITSQRYYLADADFLVGLESDEEELLCQVDRALTEPIWPLYLGRKAFVPGEPVRMPVEPPFGPGLRAEPLEESLRSYPWQQSGQFRQPPDQLRLVLDATPEESYEVRQDVPLSFESSRRRFGTRYVRTCWIPRPEVAS